MLNASQTNFTVNVNSNLNYPYPYSDERVIFELYDGSEK